MSLKNESYEQNTEEVEKRGNFIVTYSGAKFWIEEKDLTSVPIEDLAHALAMNCRFNGHVKNFYSVAEHSVHISNLVSEENALWGLLHDLTESVIPDIPRPFKSLITGFQNYEDGMAKNLAEAYELDWPMPKEVKYYDTHIVAAEADQLFIDKPSWTHHYDNIDIQVQCWSPKRAKEEFLKRYYQLINLKTLKRLGLLHAPNKETGKYLRM